MLGWQTNSKHIQFLNVRIFNSMAFCCYHVIWWQLVNFSSVKRIYAKIMCLISLGVFMLCIKNLNDRDLHFNLISLWRLLVWKVQTNLTSFRHLLNDLTECSFFFYQAPSTSKVHPFYVDFVRKFERPTAKQKKNDIMSGLGSPFTYNQMKTLTCHLT